MMDLRVSVVLLFVFLTGGYSLKCYSCESDVMGCDVVNCTGNAKCVKIKTEPFGVKVSITSKACAPCVPGTVQLPTGGTVTTSCCDTDLCNAADGVSKGSLLLLFSPLLFYFLFQ